MDYRSQKNAPRPQPMVKALKAYFGGPWTVTAETRWELRLLCQLIEQGPGQFQINIAMIANREGDAQNLQHGVYLTLNKTQGRLLLGWAKELNRPFEQTRAEFQTLYPLERLVAEIVTALAAYPVEVNIPEIDPRINVRRA